MTDDWFEFLDLLLNAGARFVVVGAHALAVHGVPRATQDVDLLIDVDPANVSRVWQALGTFGAPLDDLHVTRQDLETPGMVVQLGLPPNRIDLLTAISGVPDFATAWESRVVHEVRGRQVPFLGRELLIKNKEASGRRKDLADVEALTNRVKRRR
jgi:hypothetical protein